MQVRARVEEKVRAWAEVGVRMRGEGEAEVEGEGEGEGKGNLVKPRGAGLVPLKAPLGLYSTKLPPKVAHCA